MACFLVWLQTAALVAVEAAVIIALGAQLQRRAKSKGGVRKALWQICILSALVLAVCELSGVGRGMASGRGTGSRHRLPWHWKIGIPWNIRALKPGIGAASVKAPPGTEFRLQAAGLGQAQRPPGELLTRPEFWRSRLKPELRTGMTARAALERQGSSQVAVHGEDGFSCHDSATRGD